MVVVKRLSRKRMTQEQMSMRKANVTSADEITVLWAAGQQILERFSASRPVPMAHLPDEGPHIEAQVQDMPHTRPQQDAMLNAIAREAYVYRNPVRTRSNIFLFVIFIFLNTTNLFTSFLIFPFQYFCIYVCFYLFQKSSKWICVSFLHLQGFCTRAGSCTEEEYGGRRGVVGIFSINLNGSYWRWREWPSGLNTPKKDVSAWSRRRSRIQ